MRKRRLLLLPIASLLYIFISLYLSAPARAAEVSQCDPSRNLTFACLGEAVNATLLSPRPEDRTKENMARNASDLTISLLTSFNILLGGVPQSVRSQATGLNQYSGPPNPYIEGRGALGALAFASGMLYDTHPGNWIDNGQFFRQALANNLLNPQPALAQGPGMNILSTSGFLDLWRLFRNIAYLALAAGLAIFGLMVMLRAKADPRTTVTFQMALPRVAIALVLIYFSLPIAGLAFDVAEVGTGVIRSFFCVGGDCPLNTANFDATYIIQKNIKPWPLDPTTWPITADFGQLVAYFVSNIGELGVCITTSCGQGGLFPSTNDLINGLVATLLRLFAFTIVLRVAWTLLSRYTMFLIQAIFAPILFALGVLPTQEDAFSRWLRQIMVSTLTFPGIFLLINIANTVRYIGQNLLMPTAVGQATTINVTGLIAIGLLGMAPRVPALLEELFDVVPGAHAARAGAEPGAILRGIPVVGRFAG